MKILFLVLITLFLGCDGDYQTERDKQHYKYAIQVEMFAQTYLVDSYTVEGSCITLESGTLLKSGPLGATKPVAFKCFTHCGSFTVEEK